MASIAMNLWTFENEGVTINLDYMVTIGRFIRPNKDIGITIKFISGDGVHIMDKDDMKKFMDYVKCRV